MGDCNSLKRLTISLVTIYTQTKYNIEEPHRSTALERSVIDYSDGGGKERA